MATSVVDRAATYVDTCHTVATVSSGTGAAHSRALLTIIVILIAILGKFEEISRTGSGLNSLGYHGIDALDERGRAAASVVHLTLVYVGAIIPVSRVASWTGIAEECSRRVSTSNPGIHGARSMISSAFVYVLDASWISTFGLPALGK